MSKPKKESRYVTVEISLEVPVRVSVEDIEAEIINLFASESLDMQVDGVSVEDSYNDVFP